MANHNDEVTGWTGWIGFASAMLGLVGFFHIIEGIAALINDTLAFITPESIWILDVTTWGWLHIFGGIVLILAAGSLLAGGMFGRVIAVVVAMLSAIINMVFLPFYPVWSIVMIVIDVLVIYAVMAHGSELKEV